MITTKIKTAIAIFVQRLLALWEERVAVGVIRIDRHVVRVSHSALFLQVGHMSYPKSQGLLRVANAAIVKRFRTRDRQSISTARSISFRADICVICVT